MLEPATVSGKDCRLPESEKKLETQVETGAEIVLPGFARNPSNLIVFRCTSSAWIDVLIFSQASQLDDVKNTP